MPFEVSLQTFVAESREMLANMEHALLAIESSPDRSETVHAIFRAAHTIKGSAGLFGLESIVSFTHAVESVLDEVRDGWVGVDDALVVLLLSCCDHLTAQVDALERGDDCASEEQKRIGASLIDQLRLYLRHAESPAPTTASAAQEAKGAPASAAPKVWHLSLRFGPDVLRHGMDPLSFIRYLDQLGQVTGIATVHDALPDAEDMDPESCYLGFELGFATRARREAIESVFDLMHEDCTLRIVAPDSPLEAYAALVEQLDKDRSRMVDALIACGSVRENERAALLSLAAAYTERPPLELPAAPPGTVATADPKRPQLTDGVSTSSPSAGTPMATVDPRGRDSRSVRIDADKLDLLINLVGELTIAGTTADLLARQSGNPVLLESLSRMSGLIQEVRDSALQLRMVKIGATFARFQRVVHDMAKNLGKDIALQISGEDAELDKTLVEKLTDPLTHLVRNAIDHGIEPIEQRIKAGKPEQGTVHLNAYHESGHIVIQISDDGAGLNRERILATALARGMIDADQRLTDTEVFDLIFEPGFSTTEHITSFSGRGVGMDVVKRNIAQLRGRIDIHSTPGQGITVSLRLPLTLASINGFLVGVGDSMFVIPMDTIEECIDFHADTSHDYCDLRGQVLPFVRLRHHFGIEAAPPRRESVVVVRHGDQRFGLVVDRLQGELQTVIKPLGRMFNPIKSVSGSTILGQGEVALILDVPAILKGLEKRQPTAIPAASLAPQI